jgi:cysteine-rich repeat protein
LLLIGPAAVWACSDQSGGSDNPVCGDLTVETGEDCDTAPPASGVYGCRAGFPCGNGILDDGEECDDGNDLSGDGCSSGCIAEGVCGDGIADPSEECDGSDPDHGVECDGACLLVRTCGDGWLDPGETCDDATGLPVPGCDSQCQMENPAAVCGNGLLEEGEQCDDGNDERHDGCNQCRWVQTLYTARMSVALPFTGYDFADGQGTIGQWDCRVDNAIGRDEIRDVLSAGLQYAIDSEFALLFSFDHLEDPRGINDEEVIVYVYSGMDADGDVRTSRMGGDLYYVREAGLRPDGSPITTMTGRIEGSRLDIATEVLLLGVTAGPFVVNWGMAHPRLTGTLVNDGRRIVGLENGHIVGAMTVRSIAEYHEVYTEYAAVLANLDPAKYDSFLSLIIYGVLELGSDELFQPDVDVDGDGLEQFFDSNPGDDLFVIDVCVDGDGTEIRGEHCVLDPGIQDGFSFTYRLQAVWVRLGGVRE